MLEIVGEYWSMRAVEFSSVLKRTPSELRENSILNFQNEPRAKQEKVLFLRIEDSKIKAVRKPRDKDYKDRSR